MNGNRIKDANSWLKEQTEVAPEGEEKKVQISVGDDFKTESKILVYVPLEDLSKYIPICKEIQRRKGKKFSIEQILLDGELITEAGIKWEERTYTLAEDLSEKLKDPAFQRKLSVPVLAIDDETGENIEAKMLVPLGTKTSKKEVVKAMKRFRQECFYFIFLKNPYIPSIRGIIAKKTGKMVIPFVGLATKYIQSGEKDSYTLDQLIKAVDKFSVEEVVSIVQPIASALRTIHNDYRDEYFYDALKASLVHRDINPSVIRILKNGELYVYDFALAKIISRDEDIQTGGEQTAVGTVVGNVKYISFEQAHGVVSTELKPTTDVYSLCVIAYELMTGKIPYGTDDPEELIERVRLNQFTKITEVADHNQWGSKVLEMIDSGMALSPKARMSAMEIRGKKYRWAARFEETMREFVEQKPVPALLDEQGNYSGRKAAEVRSKMITI